MNNLRYGDYEIYVENEMEFWLCAVSVYASDVDDAKKKFKFDPL